MKEAGTRIYREARTIVLEGVSVRFTALEWGEDGPLALCLHGYPDSPWSWQPIAERLVTAGYRVVAPWMRGYGPTGEPRDRCYRIGALAHDAMELHTLAGGDDRAVLIGHDWGAVAASTVAGVSDQPFARIATLSVPPLPVLRGAARRPKPDWRLLFRQIQMSWYAVYQQVPGIAEASMSWLVPLLWRTWSPGLEARNEVAHAWEAIKDHRKSTLAYYRAVLRPFGVPTAYRALDRAWVRGPVWPVLYLHGEDDGCMAVDWVEHADLLLPDESSAYRVAGAGHFLQVEQPDIVARRLLEYFAAHS